MDIIITITLPPLGELDLGHESEAVHAGVNRSAPVSVSAASRVLVGVCYPVAAFKVGVAVWAACAAASSHLKERLWGVFRSPHMVRTSGLRGKTMELLIWQDREVEVYREGRRLLLQSC